MNTYTNIFALELSNALSITGASFQVEVVDLGAYGPSCEITKVGSDRKLHITPVEGDLIDIALFDDGGTTIASGTLFAKAAKNITSEELASLVAICF